MIGFIRILVSMVIMFFSLVGVLFIILKGYDYYLIKKEILARKNIGSFKSYESWYKSVKEVCCKWIINIPKVQVNDNLNFVLLEKITGKYYKNELQAWQRAGLLLGISHYSKEHLDDIETTKILSIVILDIFDDKYKWKLIPDHVDYALLAYSIMKLPQYNDNYYNAMCEVVDVITNSTGEDGTVFYRKHISKYRLVDTVGMICPFLIRFGYLYNKPELIELAMLQLKKYMEYGLHSCTGIPSHAYHIEYKMPLGIYGWGRGVGWYALGLIDSYEELQDNHSKKDFLKSEIVKLCVALVAYQRNDGGWGHSFFVENNIYDSSATAMAVYFLKKAISLDINNLKIYVGALEKGIKKLRLSTRIDGTIDFSQGDTKGIGIYSTISREFPFTQGMTLMVLSI